MNRSVQFLLAFLIASASPVTAQVIRVVDDDGQGTAVNCDASTLAFATVSAAIGAATNGDTVLVCPGTYRENIDFGGKAITVRSVAGPGVTILDGNGLTSVVSFRSGETAGAVLEGFTVRNGAPSYPADGGGIRISNASPVIRRNVIVNNLATAGGGISVNLGSPMIEENTIAGNGSTWSGWGGGIYLVGASFAVIRRNRILDNFIGSGGGGIEVNGASAVLIEANLIAGNTAQQGGGIEMMNQVNATIVGNVIVHNRASQKGGGIYWLVPTSATVLANNTIAENDSAWASGVFADGYDLGFVLVNNIITAPPGQTAVFCGDLNDLNIPTFRSNNVFSSTGLSYGGLCASQTGSSGNISADPLFADPASNDFHILPGSPAIDTGDNSAPGLNTTDIDNHERVLDGDGDSVARVDLGADEAAAGPASNLPGAFVRVSPGTGSQGLEAVVVLAWGESAGATGYEYCYDKTDNGTCDGTWTPAWGSTSATILGLDSETTYYWHVRARNAAGTTYADGTGSAYWPFTTRLLEPKPFAKSSPWNGAQYQQTTLTLNWGASALATSYEYCYDTVNNNTCDSTWLSAGNATNATMAGLSGYTMYFWQVRALNAAGTTQADGFGSSFWRFTTGMPAPAGFTKTGPANGAQSVATAGTVLQWGASAGADNYQFCIDTTDNGLCDNSSWSWVGSGNTQTIWWQLNPSTTYYWQVRALNGGGTTDADGGAFWSFATAGAGPAISTSDLPGAQGGVAYSVQLAASGGVPPYNWTPVGASWPPGLSLSASGVIAGKPTTAGVYSFRVRVDDSAGGFAERDFMLTVDPFRRYFAEGASSGFFDCYFALVNPSETTSATVLLTFLRSDLQTYTRAETVPPRTRRTVNTKDVSGMWFAPAFSTVVESNIEVVVDRTMSWDGLGYGSHAETSIGAPAHTWYLAEGATQNGFQLYYCIENPNAGSVDVEVTYLRSAPNPPFTITYPGIPAHTRKTIYVNGEDSRLAWGNVSAVVTSVTPNRPIIVERAMYLDGDGVMFNAGQAAAGVTAPASEWFLAEGATVATFDTFITLANPNTVSGTATITYLLTDGRTAVKTYALAASSRQTVWVNGESDDVDPALTLSWKSFSAKVSSTVPIIVERSMWWSQVRGGPWIEGHNAVGTTETGTVWAVADGEQGGSRPTDTYVLVANTSPFPARIRVTVVGEDGTTPWTERDVPANSRTTFWMGGSAVTADSPFGGLLDGKKFGAIVESVATAGRTAQIVVERAMYSDANGVVWAAGTDVVATKLK